MDLRMTIESLIETSDLYLKYSSLESSGYKRTPDPEETRIINSYRRYIVIMARLHVLTVPLSFYSDSDTRVLDEITACQHLYPADMDEITEMAIWLPSLRSIMAYYEENERAGPRDTWEKKNPISPFCDSPPQYRPSFFDNHCPLSKMALKRPITFSPSVLPTHI
jgi:hypothetical protein